jgi:hypothetical protein
MPIVAGSLAEFIRGIGYHAIPCGNDVALSVPIAIQAGLGHVRRHGRFARVSPLASKGILEFCDVYTKCAHECPSNSIP